MARSYAVGRRYFLRRGGRMCIFGIFDGARRGNDQVTDFNGGPEPTVSANSAEHSASPTSADDDQGNGRARAIVIGGIVVLLVAVAVGVVFALTRSEEASDEELQADLTERICSVDPELTKLMDLTGEDDQFTGCTVTVTKDVIEIQAAIPQDLEAIGEEHGWWSAAEVARMGQTRALDGMQSSSNGKVTWTYHPDNGLQIIVER